MIPQADRLWIYNAVQSATGDPGLAELVCTLAETLGPSGRSRTSSEPSQLSPSNLLKGLTLTCELSSATHLPITSRQHTATPRLGGPTFPKVRGSSALQPSKVPWACPPPFRTAAGLSAQLLGLRPMGIRSDPSRASAQALRAARLASRRKRPLRDLPSFPPRRPAPLHGFRHRASASLPAARLPAPRQAPPESTPTDASSGC